MAVRLTESRLRQIIREEASRLSRRSRPRSLRESASRGLAMNINEIIALIHPDFNDLEEIRASLSHGDAEGALQALMNILMAAEEDPDAASMAMEAAEAIQGMEESDVLATLKMVEEFSGPADERLAPTTPASAGFSSSDMAAISALASVYKRTLPPRAVAYAKRTGDTDSIVFNYLLKGSEAMKFQALVKKHGATAPTNKIARAVAEALANS